MNINNTASVELNRLLAHHQNTYNLDELLVGVADRTIPAIKSTERDICNALEHMLANRQIDIVDNMITLEQKDGDIM